MERIGEGNYGKIALDSNCFIYLIEGSPFAEKLTDLFHSIETGTVQGVTSILTLTEILTGPFLRNDHKLVEEYRSTLLNFPNLIFREMNYPIAIKSAQFRARFGLKTPDAIQLATAVFDEADTFITNDSDFKNVDFPVIFL